VPRGFSMVLPPDADLSDLTPYIEEIEDREREYRKLKAELSAPWREQILARDSGACRSCGATEAPDLLLHLAHITSAQAFNRYYGYPDGLRLSFRDDNLVMLCGYCHNAEHGRIELRLTTEQRAAHKRMHELLDLRDVQRFCQAMEKRAALIANGADDEAVDRHHSTARARELYPLPTVAEYIDLSQRFGQAIAQEHHRAHERHRNVRALFDRLIAERGWKSVPSLAKKLNGGVAPPHPRRKAKTPHRPH